MEIGRNRNRGFEQEVPVYTTRVSDALYMRKIITVLVFSPRTK